MRPWRFAILLAAILLVPQGAQARPDVEIQTTTQIDKPLHAGCEFSTDAMRVNVKESGKLLAALDFCSSYGEADAHLVADRKGYNYLMLEFGQGHGTNAVTRYLGIYRLSDDLYELTRIPISWAVGPTQTFGYSYRVMDDNSGGLKIELIGADVPGSECCNPPEKIWTIRIDPEQIDRK